jgi:hypothetical protein
MATYFSCLRVILIRKPASTLRGSRVSGPGAG